MLRVFPVVMIVIAAVGAITPQGNSYRSLLLSPADSALAEFEAGRFWHAARMLREEGAAAGTPEDVLLLARAEAGWKNWSAVAELLDGAEWLSEESDAIGLYILGRAWEAQGQWAEAAESYGRYVDLGSLGTTRHHASIVRRTRSLWKSGEREASFISLRQLEPHLGAQSWTALEIALGEARDGNASSVEDLLGMIEQPLAQLSSWRLLPDALFEAGDLIGATEAFRQAYQQLNGDRRATAAIELAELLLAGGDTATARGLLLEGLEEAPGAFRDRAAAELFDLGDTDRELTLELARILDRAGDGRRALTGYDRVVALSANTIDGVSVPLPMRVERARLMGTVQTRQEEAIQEFRAIRDVTTDDRIGGRNLELWAQLRRRQGLDEHVRTLRRWLLEEHPNSSEAAEVAWSRASQADSRGELDSALRQYAVLSSNARTHARAGQARMRSGQIYLGRSDRVQAAGVFEGYLEDFPEGRRWQEASYWAGRMRMELGDTSAAEKHIRQIKTRDPVSYYAVIGAELLGELYTMNVSDADDPAIPPWLNRGLSDIDLFTEAGLEQAAVAEIDRLREVARTSKNDMLGLAEGLIARGRTIDGINLGWALRDEGHEWDSRLIRVAFPLPYLDLIRREAMEWGVDPIILAAIIRQESAFKADIVSRAGAIGLMQVMPPTGAQLARVHGPSDFQEAHLASPEVSLHLGAAYFVEMSARYDGVLPLILSAYNAGPTRATRWKQYPEISDLLRFTERIPFVETRGYVKNVRRNLGIYGVLYGQN
ncbi:MAG: transglycosylase SLT domain-containing protein [Gemmatimonadetes bacterium]|nr:transglycosylase SLT domain-containing protein [Gemmatimonadota bacterium]